MAALRQSPHKTYLNTNGSVRANIWGPPVYLVLRSRTQPGCSVLRLLGPETVPSSPRSRPGPQQLLHPQPMCCCQTPLPAQSPSLPVLSTSTCMVTIQTHFSCVSAPQVTSPEAQPHSLLLCHSHDPSISPAFQTPTPRTSPPQGRGYHSPAGRAPRVCGPVSATVTACESLSDLLSGPLFQPL